MRAIVSVLSPSFPAHRDHVRLPPARLTLLRARSHLPLQERVLLRRVAMIAPAAEVGLAVEKTAAPAVGKRESVE